MKIQYSLKVQLDNAVQKAFVACGYPAASVSATRSAMPGVQFQCNNAFAVAKANHTNPLIIAQQVAAELCNDPMIAFAEAAVPGFINILIDDQFLATYSEQHIDGALIPVVSKPATIVIDYGGANVAKPLHVGHLRSALIGEALKRTAKALGHSVVADVHLGDWGLQMGMVIEEMRNRYPHLPYFSSTPNVEYPATSPVTMADLDVLYPAASKRAKEDPDVMQEARRTTVELQQGNPAYRALWKHFVEVSVQDLRDDYEALDVHFDLWEGESDAHETVEMLTAQLVEDGLAHVSEGALVLPVAQNGDTKELPPLLLRNSDGAELYGATDLATIAMRAKRYALDEIVYVVDKRQSLHLMQVFRAAALAHLASDTTLFTHVAFGTMNGTDNKPFKTRAGGTMKLKDLLAMVQEQAEARLAQNGKDSSYDVNERARIAHAVGIAALKFGDLSNHHEKNYVFDLQRFLSFEGYTGPYMLYSAVRARSILVKAEQAGAMPGTLLPPKTGAERNLHIRLAELPDTVTDAWVSKSPSVLCEYVYQLANEFSAFYHECPVLSETDTSRQRSHLQLTRYVYRALVEILGLLGIDVPERM